MLAAMPEHSSLVPGVTAQTTFAYGCRGQFCWIDDVLRFPSFQMLGWVSVTSLAISSPCPREKSGTLSMYVLSKVLYRFFVTLRAFLPGSLIIGRFALGIWPDRLWNGLASMSGNQTNNEQRKGEKTGSALT